METKVCRDCQIEKPLDDFYKNPKTKDGRVSYCKPCNNQRAYNSPKFKENARRWNLKTLYGITPEYYDLMAEKQDNKCGICRQEERVENKYLCVDHDHETNVVRGLLCHACNIGLGKFEDNIERLESAIDYLKKHLK